MSVGAGGEGVLGDWRYVGDLGGEWSWESVGGKD